MVKAVSGKILEYTGKVQPQLGKRGANGQLLYPYLPNPELVEAVNLAIYLERPLLLKGEPGCGKTQLASAVAYELGLNLEAWYVKSTSRARDGLYNYDAVGRLGKAGIYYFHNCPIDYLYHDPHHQQAVLFSHIVTHVCSERTAVLIFSDAGAARGGFSEERYRLTEAFLQSLKQQVRYISWLNPMPRKRWLGTTAGEISLLVPMFEVSRRGLQDAIGVLRGHPTNFENRRI